MKRLYTLVAAVLLAIVATACNREETQRPATPPARQQPLVFASNYPLLYFATRLAGERIDTLFPIPVGEDPAFWRPTEADLLAMQDPALLLFNGATYEKWSTRVSLPESRVVNTSAAFRADYITMESAVTHSHGPGGEHAHAGTDFNTWLDPTQAILQARAVANALVAILPDDEAAILAAMEALAADLTAIDGELRAAIGAAAARPILASHPVYGYLARRYDLNLRAVTWEPGEVAPEEEWAALETLLKEHPARWMIWEGTPSAENVARLRALGVESAVFATANNRPESGDYMAVMRSNVMEMARVYAP